jgi:hypothetical protein
MLLLIVVIQVAAYYPDQIIRSLCAITLEILVLLMKKIFIISDDIVTTAARGEVTSLKDA